MGMQFFDLVRNALPEDVETSELTCLGKPEWWQNRQRLACAYALRKCPRINWQAYLARYPDVAEAGIDPVLHFVRRGVYEGCKLFSGSQHVDAATSSGIKVSVIIPNYNNGIYLHKAISSVIGQTLREIEIIVVDDGSTDDSRAIIKDMERQDKRVRSIIFDANKSQHMARKAGVAIARGDYVMFLDPDDSYQSNACEVAYNTIRKGYDIVSFNKNVINLVNLSENEVAASYRSFTLAENGLHPGDTLLHDTFINYKLLYSLVFKIFDRKLIQKAFGKLEDGHFLPLEDGYAMLPIMHLAKNLYKIPDRLYNQTVGCGTSTYHGSEEETLRRFRMGPMVEAARAYCESNDIEEYFEGFKLSCFYNVTATIPLMGTHLVRKLMDHLAEYYGLLWSVCGLARVYRWRIRQLTKLLDPVNFPGIQHRNNKRIAIIQSAPTNDGMHFIEEVCGQLPSMGYKISLLSYNDPPAILSRGISCHRVTEYEKDSQQHLADLYDALRETKPAVVMFSNPVWPELPMQLLLMRFMGIQGIAHIPVDNAAISMEKCSAEMLQVLGCLDKVICSGTTRQIYLRSQGVDAECLSSFGMAQENDWQTEARLCREPVLNGPQDELGVQGASDVFARLLETFAVHSEIAPYMPAHYQRALEYMAGVAGA